MSSGEEGVAAPACQACRGAHRAHTCGRAVPHKRKRRPMAEIQLKFDHPGVRMKRGACDACVDKDMEIERLKMELAGAREDAARYRDWWLGESTVRCQSVCSLPSVLCPLSVLCPISCCY